MSLARFFSSPSSALRAARGGDGAPMRRPPPIGTTLCCNQFRLSVQAGLGRDLWQWLTAQGWRVLPPGDSRYRYRALPSDVVAALIDAAPEQRERLLALGMRRALEAPDDAGKAARVVTA